MSTVSKSFYLQHCSDKPIQPLSQILNIECADGNNLPYEGYVQLSMELHGVPKSCSQVEDGLFLVVPDSKYNSAVPVLIGTNILAVVLDRTKEAHGERFLQTADLHTPFYLAFRCMKLRDRELEQRKGRLAIIRAIQPVTIKPNTEVVIEGYLDKEVPYQPVCSLIHTTKNSAIPDDLDLTPALVTYRYRGSGVVKVQVTNVSTRTVTVPSKAIICELQPVNIEDVSQVDNDDVAEDVLEKVEISTDNLSAPELQQGKDFLSKYRDIFSSGEEDIGHTDMV